MNVPCEQRTPPTVLELAGEVSDLAAGAGILTFALAPLALPLLALTALIAVALLVPMLVGAMLLAPCLVARRWLRSRDRSSRATAPAEPGGKAVTRTRRGTAPTSPASPSAGQVT